MMKRYNDLCEDLLDWCDKNAAAVFVTLLGLLFTSFVVLVVGAFGGLQ